MGDSLEQVMRLWSDEPSAVDLLAFGAVAETVVDAVLDDALDPVALCVSGTWGSGKTTVLRLIEDTLCAENNEDANQKALIVPTDPWRYDPSVGIKESLISEVLAYLEGELVAKEGIGSKAFGVLKELSKRVDWAKGLRLAARASLTLQLPSVDDLTDLIRFQGDGEDGTTRGLESFRDEFERLMESDDLAHIRRVVVLVDDLDRCLPETVIDTLETIRLFLSVSKMSFVITADEERVAMLFGHGTRGPIASGPARVRAHQRNRPSSISTKSSRRPFHSRRSAASTPRRTCSYSN